MSSILWRPAGRAGVVAILALAVLALSVPPATAQVFNYTVYVCKKLLPRDTSFVYRECGNKFTTQDAYIGLVVILRDLTERTEVSIELFDPDQTSVWTTKGVVSPPPGYYYSEIPVWRVLLINADLPALANESVQLTGGVIKFEGKPARERLGEWNFKVTINRGVRQVKFTLQGAP